MALVDSTTLANDGVFQNRIQAAMVLAAVNISSEPSTIHPAVDLKRFQLATQVVNNPAAFVVRFSNTAIAAGTLTAQSADVDIFASMGGIWNVLAGVSSADQGK